MRSISELEAIILSILISSPNLRGLEIIEKSEKKLKRGTIYVYLSRMISRGLVESKFDGEELEQLNEWKSENRVPQPPRRIYRATPDGEIALRGYKATLEDEIRILGANLKLV